MKFSIGYQLPDENDNIYDIVTDFREDISSVYFPAPGQASARSVVGEENSRMMLEELQAIRELGVSTVLLYNANCYGDEAISPAFKKNIVDTVTHMIQQAGITDITTTSPFVARVVKSEFPQIRVCASVNMWIGTQQAMEFLSADFDGFYLQREYNRDFEKIANLKRWCDEHGKQLRLLANSGCFYTCPFHTFHDNLVAHESGVSQGENAFSDQPSPCWDYMRGIDDIDAAAAFLQASWIHPNDIPRYAVYFDEVKLATRMHSNPRRVVMAFTMGRFAGNMLDLTEPSYSRRFPRHILDAVRFPADWFERTSRCSRDCDQCGYCRRTAENALILKSDLEKMYLSAKA